MLKFYSSLNLSSEPADYPIEDSLTQEEYEQAVNACKQDVRNQYELLLQNCQVRYGASSAAEACKSIYEDEMEQALKDCESY